MVRHGPESVVCMWSRNTGCGTKLPSEALTLRRVNTASGTRRRARMHSGPGSVTPTTCSCLRPMCTLDPRSPVQATGQPWSAPLVCRPFRTAPSPQSPAAAEQTQTPIPPSLHCLRYPFPSLTPPQAKAASRAHEPAASRDPYPPLIPPPPRAASHAQVDNGPRSGQAPQQKRAARAAQAQAVPLLRCPVLLGFPKRGKRPVSPSSRRTAHHGS
mmetsp:Transcript_15984/g.43552  ORF Transcript_15984/g.43552 Transcript_15984/m.43552 type:complete len:214 (-) Transcript_15984:1600-2241(-)